MYENPVGPLPPTADAREHRSYFIRIACDILIPYLTNLCSLSLKFGSFPDCLKTAKVIPIHKAGTNTETNNYRPISL